MRHSLVLLAWGGGGGGGEETAGVWEVQYDHEHPRLLDGGGVHEALL